MSIEGGGPGLAGVGTDAQCWDIISLAVRSAFDIASSLQCCRRRWVI